MRLLWILLVLVLVGCGNAAGAAPTGQDVVAAFKGAGLEAESPTEMTQADYGMAPMVCDGTRFLIPSLGENTGGRVFVCGDDADQESLKAYYDTLGESSAALFSWTFEKGDVLVQINGTLPEETAQQYEAAIP